MQGPGGREVERRWRSEDGTDCKKKQTKGGLKQSIRRQTEEEERWTRQDTTRPDKKIGWGMNGRNSGLHKDKKVSLCILFYFILFYFLLFLFV